ncbi:NYN domain-containing protein [Nocardioides sp. YIM 152315]|uniref:NYN domain-containing protein n=1 Tax=Nocardioides sp. YIM 152315 TaxID=3031760 RepID=UPI0023DCC214|nr:NYN domain-containing protein [Nocardioides sp. YIM 152315]MDF1602678.1 NYN domain-containing protein [Nocardioides sp. YIM 152315]
MSASEPRALAGLPEPVRTRVVAQTAEVLPDVPSLPAAVRRVAAFAPARRARLGASAITDALADDELRERVGVQLAARPEPEDGDDAAVAARVWLVRPEGWEQVFAGRVERIAAPSREEEARERELTRLRGRLADAERTVRELREAQRAQAEEHKAEHTSLRRKVGEARAAEREARALAESATQELDAARAEVEDRVVSLEKENRRLRAEVERRDAEEAQARRVARTERDEVSLRARLLLDTVTDAAAGLRRELALPTVEGAPADRVEAEAAASGARTTSGAGALGPASPALLEQLLGMPRSRLVVDGYNVSKRAWPSSSLEAQRNRLAGGLAALVARTGAETTLVFDAAETDHRPPVVAPRGVRVLYSPRGVIADDVVRDLVAVEPSGRVVVVVTADRAVADDVARDGARVVDPEALIALMSR